MTWTAEAQRLEESLRKVWLGFETGHLRGEDLGTVDRDLKKAEVPYEEWEVLFRKELLLERRCAALDAQPSRQLRLRS